MYKFVTCKPINVFKHARCNYVSLCAYMCESNFVFFITSRCALSC